MPACARDRRDRIRKVLRLERPDRVPCGDIAWVEYRPDVYHLGEGDSLPEAGQVGKTADGTRLMTRDGGVWPTDARGKYRDHNDVLDADLEGFGAEDVAEPMLSAMARLMRERSGDAYLAPMHYGTLISRATIEFGWTPFLTALALEPEAFGRILDRFGEASRAVATGWSRTGGTELIAIHDDIAGTRGLFISPDFCRRYVFPWYGRIFAAIHEAGRKVLYISDGDYSEVLDDLLALGPDGLYVESSSMAPCSFLPRAGADKLFLIKTDSRLMDFGTPEEIHRELSTLRELHEAFPGMMIYRGGGALRPENADAFDRYYRELLVY